VYLELSSRKTLSELPAPCNFCHEFTKVQGFCVLGVNPYTGTERCATERTNLHCAANFLVLPSAAASVCVSGN